MRHLSLRFWLILLLLPASAPTTAAGVALAGGEVSRDSSYTFVGWIGPFSLDTGLAEGWFYRLGADWLRYEFEGASGKVEASAPGGEIALGRNWRVGLGNWGASVGAVYRNTALDPPSADSDVEGARLGAKFQTSINQQGAWWRIEGIASYTVGPDAYWGRLRLFAVPGGTPWPGIEVVPQGGPDYDAVQVGGVLARIGLGGDASFNLKGGVRFQEDVATSGYGGVELAWAL